MKTKFMTLITVATLGIFSAATVMAAGNNDFYTQPPAGSEWEKADTEGTYASYTNGNDYVNIYKYSLEDVKTGIAKCNDTYDACYQTIIQRETACIWQWDMQKMQMTSVTSENL